MRAASVASSSVTQRVTTLTPEDRFTADLIYIDQFTKNEKELVDFVFKGTITIKRKWKHSKMKWSIWESKVYKIIWQSLKIQNSYETKKKWRPYAFGNQTMFLLKTFFLWTLMFITTLSAGLRCWFPGQGLGEEAEVPAEWAQCRLHALTSAETSLQSQMVYFLSL